LQRQQQQSATQPLPVHSGRRKWRDQAMSLQMTPLLSQATTPLSMASRLLWLPLLALELPLQVAWEGGGGSRGGARVRAAVFPPVGGKRASARPGSPPREWRSGCLVRQAATWSPLL
jgi:hypothetical protein